MYYRLPVLCNRFLRSFLYIIITLFLTASLTTFDYTDTSFFYDEISLESGVIKNAAGWCGAQMSAILVYFFGISAWLLIPFFAACSASCIFLEHTKVFKRFIVGIVFLMVGVSLLSACINSSVYAGIPPGGICGVSLIECLALFFDKTLIYVLTIIIVFFGVVCCCGVWWGKYITRFIATCFRFIGIYKVIALLPHVRYDAKIKASEDDEAIFNDPFWIAYTSLAEQNQMSATTLSHGEAISRYEPKEIEQLFVIPSIELLKKNKHESSDDDVLLQERARNLEHKLELFGIKGEVVSITRGPVVTLFEYAPASDVKISKIIMLEDDLALALQAYSLRIIAPIPGRSVVGFEVANIHRQTVPFNEIASSVPFKKYKASVPLIIGRDTVGADVFVDLVDMPHLLVAGSTGSGKSVALNVMLASMLCKVHPDEVKLILIDPKRLEFASFADIAHLLFPIVTDTIRVPQVLFWAVKTMEERYEELASRGVRNIQDYHKLYGTAAMPYIVLVIDELADLMMSSSKGARGADIEQLIARLSQMARAAGIHLILATQRPSVDVITGIIKVNFPSRIACKVISKVDSRTILDQAGAEKLLGKGDMLFLNQKGMINRVHGAYISDQEINEIVSCIKKQRSVVYTQLETLNEPSLDDNAYDEDPLYSEVCAYVVTMEQVSISLLQRKFRIGYNRSARLIDTLESRGILMPADGSKFRKVLRS